MIPIDKIGYVIKATHGGIQPGQYVLVQRVEEGAEDYYVFIRKTWDPQLPGEVFEKGEVFDYWFKCKEHVEDFFLDWIVQWDE